MAAYRPIDNVFNSHQLQQYNDRLKRNFEYIGLNYEENINELTLNNKAILFGDIFLSAACDIDISEFFNTKDETKNQCKLCNVLVKHIDMSPYINVLHNDLHIIDTRKLKINKDFMEHGVGTIKTILPFPNSVYYNKIISIIEVNKFINVYVVKSTVELVDTIPKFFTFNYLIHMNNKLHYLYNIDDTLLKQGTVVEQYLDKFVNNNTLINAELKRYLKLGFKITYKHPIGQIQLKNEYNSYKV